MACGGESDTERHGAPASRQNPNILLLINDAWRQDSVGAYNPRSDSTPNVDAFAREAVLFESAVAQSPCTINSGPSIYFGLYPSEHRLTNYILRPSPRLKSIAELLSGGEYATFTYSTNPHVSTRSGMARGFDKAIDGFGWRQRAGDVNARFKKWLSNHEGERFFATLWYIDTHTPYNPPTTFRHKLLAPVERKLVSDRTKNPTLTGLHPDEQQVTRKLYQGAVQYFDRELGRLFRFLKREGLWDNTVIVLTSDHGEALWDQPLGYGSPMIGHCNSLRSPQIDVPLLIRAPGVKAARSGFPAQHIDLLPTILELAGVPQRPEYALRGSSLVPHLRAGGSDAPRPIFTELTLERYGPHFRRGIRVGDFGLVLTYVRGTEIHSPPKADFAVYGDAALPSVEDRARLTAGFRLQIDAWIDQLRSDDFAPENLGARSPKLAKEMEEQLKALGYLQ